MIFLLIFLVADTLNNNIAPSNIIDPTICMKKKRECYRETGWDKQKRIQQDEKKL